MDALTDMLRSARLTGGVYFRCEFAAPWGMEIPRMEFAEFHVVVRGQCWLRVPGYARPIMLSAGDVTVFMHGDPHALLDSPNARALPPSVVLDGQDVTNFGPVRYGGDGPQATVLCGYFKFERDSWNPVIRALPRFIHVHDSEASGASAIERVIAMMMQETRAGRPGAEAVINRLSEVLFIQVVRSYVEQAHPDAGVLNALADPRLSTALQRLHENPSAAWTLAGLAKEAGMSRTAFAARFHALVGQTPMEYLTAWRMESARQLLVGSKLPMAAIAERVGYGSEAALGKVFKRLLRVSPGAYRRGATEHAAGRT